jgi:hypothetical protein
LSPAKLAGDTASKNVSKDDMTKFLMPFPILLTFTPAAFAQDRGTPDDQAACEPDVHRLCDRFIPDEGQIVACLRAEKAQLSPACKTVMSRTQ